MTLTPENHYARWKEIFSEAATGLDGYTFVEQQRWAGRVHALLRSKSEFADATTFLSAFDNFSNGTMKEYSWRKMIAIICSALASAELGVSASQSGSFIPAKSPFDALVAVGKVFQEAKSELFIVDPYADQKLITDFLNSAKESILLKLMSDKASCKSSLKPAAVRWVAQYGSKRPLEIRLASEKSLHDRLIIVDLKVVWTIGQSFNALADRAPTSIVRVDAETAALKIQAYSTIWGNSETMI